MSLLPMESKLVYGLAFADQGEAHPDYTVTDGRACAVPGCTKQATDGHHLWRRSFLVGAFDWVVIEELGGFVAPNKVGLCHDCHMDIDSSLGGQKAFIVGIPNDRDDSPNTPAAIEFFWVTRIQLDSISFPDGDDVYMQLFLAALDPEIAGSRLLDPQPGPRGALEGAPRSASPDADRGATEPMQTTVDGEEVPHRHVVNQQGIEKPCGRCKGTGKIVEKEKPESDPDQPQAPARRKVTWSVRVPKDEREDGYELLTTLMEAAAEKAITFGLVRNTNAGGNYYVLLAALRKFVVGETE